MSSDRMEPLSGQGPAVELAAELRSRKTAANLTLRQMAKKCDVTPKTLSETANGRAVPTWEATKAFLIACDVPAADHDVIRQLWDQSPNGQHRPATR